MALSDLTPAKAVLLSVQLASRADISTLRTLVSIHRKTLRIELVLRILLSQLPESLDSSDYVPFLEDLVAGNLSDATDFEFDTSLVDELNDAEAKKKVRKLNLLSLAWPNAPADVPADPLVLFLIHRSIRIDQSTGLITQIPELLAPFLHHSPDLRTWMISIILPLLRLNYEYHPTEGLNLTIPKFEALDDRAGVALLLNRTGTADGSHDTTVGRDLRGLVGPWMYGDTRLKRRKLEKSSSFSVQSVEALDESSVTNHKYTGWEEVLKWLIYQADTSWKTAVEAIEQWDGPGDVDLGGYEDGTMWLDEDDQQHLERRYARSVLAVAYLITEESEEALKGVQRILTRIIVLLDQDRIPTLQAACAILSPVASFESSILAPKNVAFLRNDLLDDQNILTTPKEESIRLLHALLISANLCTRMGCPMNIRKAGELAFVQDEHDQMSRFASVMLRVVNGPKEDDKYWIRMRNEMLWLRSWGAEELSEGADTSIGRGIFGKIPKERIEVEFLKALLTNTRYNLATSIYETSIDAPLPPRILHDTVISAAMNAFDNASNASRSRGGVKKCDEILEVFHEALKASEVRDELTALTQVTDEIGNYRLVLKQGEPFKPVNLRAHSDPISIIGKILYQNSRSYTKIRDFVEIGNNMVLAGLTARDENDIRSRVMPKDVKEEQLIAEKRVVSMCIDAALSEDDFETAYSYVVTHLKDVAGPAHVRTPELERKKSGLFAEPPPKIIDDWSWKAALEAGKYRRTALTIKPTHLGNTTSNMDIRHLEQRMECLSHALRLGPRAALQEILNVYRRCEEELESLVKQEAEQEAAWDAQMDDESNMPGGFAATPMKKNTTTSSSRAVEEAPMSLFDLSRASMARAQSGFSALSMLRGSNGDQRARSDPTSSGEGSRVVSPTTDGSKPMRKRDQLKNAAVGGLASGIGWVLGAPTPHRSDDED
ncbi:related to protein transport protein Sec39 [Phialocephala subalpina]|uniref:Related to protein transport protein Sec39 n=1 Tax=Phialocephala subalpina TaxID=576137 RepID=A0A1L7XMQ3_9HELO|nr:related to protein transport protein Sec39 [Phialocephala subalpina]